MADYLSVADFFYDRSVFITGGTGFIGKVLVEKLLRSCPEIKNIYLLIRPKRNHDPKTRLMEIINSSLFDNLRKDRPSALDKIVLITGDVTEPRLGISESDRNLLIRTVSVVFHSAASIKFEDTLKSSMTVNVLVIKRLVEFCREMSGLKALIHVSTAYSNCDRKEVKEMIYPTMYDPEKIIECMEWMDQDLIDTITPKVIGNRPNVYTFTKALGEKMLEKESGKLPVAIVRPSIVLSSMKEPVAGWVDNFNGPTGLVAAIGKGISRTIYGRGEKVADLIPVDVVVNLMIVAAWATAMSRYEEIKVYNCCSGMQNPITWEKFVEHCNNYFRKHSRRGLLWYPYACVCSNQLLHRFFAIWLQTLPAFLIDICYRLTGKKPSFVKLQQRLSKANQSLAYFGLNEWSFYNENVQHLNSILSNVDREVFSFDVRNIDWTKYVENYVLGIKTFLLKESPSALLMARR